MHLLRELDGYLTPDEARRFRATATDVIHKYRETLSARFKMAVSDHRWEEAIEFGEVITQQFPNTKMTEEVQGMLETIRVRAEEDETSS
jgi:outer membrane protein assembly factor BamD (BamD/ComL family)